MQSKVERVALKALFGSIHGRTLGETISALGATRSTF